LGNELIFGSKKLIAQSTIPDYVTLPVKIIPPDLAPFAELYPKGKIQELDKGVIMFPILECVRTDMFSKECEYPKIGYGFDLDESELILTEQQDRQKTKNIDFRPIYAGHNFVLSIRGLNSSITNWDFKRNQVKLCAKTSPSSDIRLMYQTEIAAQAYCFRTTEGNYAYVQVEDIFYETKYNETVNYDQMTINDVGFDVKFAEHLLVERRILQISYVVWSMSK
jgi:hypothetical protein